MIFTKKEMKEKTIEEIFSLINDDQDILITDNQESYYKALYDESMKEHHNGQLKEVLDINSHTNTYFKKD